MADSMGEDGKLYWFLGIIEDLDDPLQIGRVRIRHIEEHNPSQAEYVETDDLPWSIPLTATASSSRFGIGLSPTGVNVGSYAFGFYLDGPKKTKPAFVATWPVYAEENEKHSVSRLARGIAAVEKEYLPDEPKSQFAAEYPFNKTLTTTQGHVIEVDDTPENERIHIYHRAGTYIEMNPDGSLVIKSIEKKFDMVANSSVEYIGGNNTITIKGNQDVILKGNQTVTVDGNVTYEVGGTVTIDCDKVKMTGDLDVDGTVTGDKVKTASGVDLGTHTHGGVDRGKGSTLKPN